MKYIWFCGVSIGLCLTVATEFWLQSYYSLAITFTIWGLIAGYLTIIEWRKEKTT